jgi:alpha-glucosidase
MTSPTIAASIRSSGPWPISTPDRPRPRRGPEDHHRSGLRPHLGPARLVQESRQSRTNPKADWFVWADAKADGSPPSNWQSVFGGPAWTWDARRGQYYMHNFLPEQPQLNLHNPMCRTPCWTPPASGWIAASTASASTPSTSRHARPEALTDNPPLPPGGKRTRPFDFQDKVHNQSQPGIVDFLARLRALTDSYRRSLQRGRGGGDTGRCGDAGLHPGDDRLNSAYGFLYLYAPTLTPDLVRMDAAAWHGRPDRAGPPGPSPTTTPRAPSRAGPRARPEGLRPDGDAAADDLRGNVFIYQGEELGLPQAEVPFDRLVDPEAIANWPRPWAATAPARRFRGRR